MKGKATRFILFFSAIILCHLVMTKLAVAADLKFAYVDIGKVFDDYEKTKQFDQQLQEEGKAKQGKRDALVLEVRRLRDEQSLLADAKKKESQGTIEAKLKELEDFDAGTQKELGERRNTIMKEIFADIDDVIKRYGERKGYDIIFNERALLHKNANLDQTGEVLKELNNEYSKKKK